MLSKDEALARAASHLERAYADDEWTIVVLSERSYRYCAGWIVCWDTQESIDAGVPVGPINTVLIVPDDGAEPHGTPSYATYEQFREFRETGIWPAALRMPR